MRGANPFTTSSVLNHGITPFESFTGQAFGVCVNTIKTKHHPQNIESLITALRGFSHQANASPSSRPPWFFANMSHHSVSCRDDSHTLLYNVSYQLFTTTNMEVYGRQPATRRFYYSVLKVSICIQSNWTYYRSTSGETILVAN